MTIYTNRILRYIKKIILFEEGGRHTRDRDENEIIFIRFDYARGVPSERTSKNRITGDLSYLSIFIVMSSDAESR